MKNISQKTIWWMPKKHGMAPLKNKAKRESHGKKWHPNQAFLSHDSCFHGDMIYFQNIKSAFTP